MKKNKPMPGLLSGIIAASIILTSATAAAGLLKNTRLFRQGRFAAALFSEETMSLAGVLSEPKKLDATLKFFGAVTAAYINFEMIPVGEARTFIAVFESLESDIEIDKFTYRGKTLEITGRAPDAATAETFRDNLENYGNLIPVNFHTYTTVDDAVRFNMECFLQ